MLFSFDIPHNIYCVKNNNGIVGNYMYNVYTCNITYLRFFTKFERFLKNLGALLCQLTAFIQFILQE